MELKICKQCGGELENKGSFYVCPYCGLKYELFNNQDTLQIQLMNAFEKLRNSDFENAKEAFDEIILSFPDNYEAYWGRALVNHGILFVNDIIEGKKVPTCTNISEFSFIEDEDVKKTLSLAPKSVLEEYQKYVSYIENIRIEWLQKASKEPPYDIFICFKDSDKEHHIERTNDSINAQELYTALTEKGYKVFFSRITLKDKVAEQYEPYIYNALKTSKVMIVYGEKAEYFNSTWMKNEWKRFANKIANKEKHKNSLIVVYKDMNVADLPLALKTRQCLNYADLKFFINLEKHIEKVIAEEKQVARLEKISITSGQKSKRVSEIKQSTIKTRNIGEGIVYESSLSEQQTLSLVHQYLSYSDWTQSYKLVEEVLFDNPNSADALMCKILINAKLKNEQELMEIKEFQDFDLLEKLLSIAPKDYAKKVLELFYQMRNLNDDDYLKILKIILPYNYDCRNKRINDLFIMAIAKGSTILFDELLTTIDSTDINQYIERLCAFTDSLLKNNHYTDQYIYKVLEVEDGNLTALRQRIHYDLLCLKPQQEFVPDFETLLKYTTNINQEIKDFINLIFQFHPTSYSSTLIQCVLKYYEADLETLEKELISISTYFIQGGLFEEAEYYLKLVLTFNKENPDVFWNICLIKTQSRNIDEIPYSNINLKNVPEVNKYMVLVNQIKQKVCFDLIAQQQKNAKIRIEALNQKIPELEKQITEAEEELKQTEAIIQNGTNKNKLKKENNLTFPILSILTLIFLALGIWGIILLTSKSNPALFAPITAIALLTSVILGAIVTFSKLKWTGALYTLIIWPIFFIILLLIAPITHIVNSLKNSKKQLEVVIQNSKQNILKSEERAQLLNERLLQNQNELKQTKELILQLEAAFQ